MRVALFANGTHGDVQPHVALAAGLRRSGNQVRFCTHLIFQKLVEDHDLEFFGLGGTDPRAVMKQVQAATVKTHLLSRLRMHFFQRRPPDAEVLRETVSACEGRDMIVSSLGTVFHVAESLGRPFIQTALYPIHPTGAFPHYLTPVHVSLGSLTNRLSHQLVRQMFWQVDRRWINRWRHDSLNLPPTSFWGPFGDVDQRRVPCLYGFSNHVIPKPKDWGDRIEVTGYWFLDDVRSWHPGADLVRFLDSGPPPVGIGFGSLVDPNPEEMHRIIFEALAQTGHRAILLTGWRGASSNQASANVFVTDWVPFNWLLPRLCAVVHHAGAGTMAEVLRAGLPSVAIPYSGEQRFWAARLAGLGACPPPIPRKRLTTAKLADAIVQACSRQAIQEQAQALGRRIQAENGVANAVECFNRFCRDWPSKNRAVP
jgi:sterol 3beta-glucosyltransferase